MEENIENLFDEPLKKKKKKKEKIIKEYQTSLAAKQYALPDNLFLQRSIILSEKYYLKCISILKGYAMTKNLSTYKVLTDCYVEGSLEENYEFLLIDSLAVDMKLLEERSMQNVKWIFIISYPMVVYRNKNWGGLENYKAVFNLPLGVNFANEKHNFYIYAFLKK